MAELLHETRLAVGCEAHHLPLVAVVWESEELGGRRVEDACGVRILDLPEHLYVVPLARPPHRRDEVAEAVYGEERRAVERRDVEGACEVRAVVLDVVELRPEAALRDAELTGQVVLQVAHLRGVGEPVADGAEQAAAVLRLHAGTVAARQTLRGARRGVQNLLVQVRRRVARDADVVDVLDRDARGLQAVADRLHGKAGAVLEAVETLLLGGSDELSVAHNGGGGVAVIGVNPQYDHKTLCAFA